MDESEGTLHERARSLVASLAARARDEGRTHLEESEAFRIAAALGITVPHRRSVADPSELEGLDLSLFPGDRVVLKIVAPVLHKTEGGGVRIVTRDRTALREAATEMFARWPAETGVEAEGLALHEFVPHHPGPGGELLLGARWSPEFGPVVAVGPGGVESERLAAALDRGRGTALLSPLAALRHAVRERLLRRTIVTLATEPLRGAPPRGDLAALEAIIARLLDLAEASMPDGLLELEMNPVVWTPGGLVALDAVARVRPEEEPYARRHAPPSGAIDRLLHPRSIAVVGVSRRMNPGRIILDNILGAGFPRDRVWVVKPGVDELRGCRAVPDVASLPEPVDLLVIAVAARELPELVERVCASRQARSLMLIPGGLGERPGSEGDVERIRSALRLDRERGGTLVANGPNCLGIRSRPGGYDTMFIPGHKIAYAQGPETPLAVLAQSGAFAVARGSRFPDLDPRYVITFGNQIDLTAADYLRTLADDPQIRVFACYVEGFRPGDGRRWLEAAAAISESRRAVILYRAGRTRSGAAAAASHTASIAGDYAVTRELAETAGAVVADSLAEFDDFVRVFVALRDRSVAGRRVGACTNAGFESVAIADGLGGLELPAFTADTTERLGRLLGGHGLETIVTVRNPLDVTPILDDEAFVRAAGAVLDDPNVDVGVVGCVPLTAALCTLPSGEGHDEDLARPTSVVERLVRLWRETTKAWVAVVDAGAAYDPMARSLERAGIPTFRTADRALAALNRYCEWALSERSARPGAPRREA